MVNVDLYVYMMIDKDTHEFVIHRSFMEDLMIVLRKLF